VTGHWIDVKDGKWELRSEVIGFRSISGEHSGANLGRHFIGICERVGIIDVQTSKVRRVDCLVDSSRSSDKSSCSCTPSHLTTLPITLQAVKPSKASIAVETSPNGRPRITSLGTLLASESSSKNAASCFTGALPMSSIWGILIL